MLTMVMMMMMTTIFNITIRLNVRQLFLRIPHVNSLFFFTALKNTPLVSFAGGVQAIARNVLDCQMPRLNESLMVTLLYLVNNAKSRPFVRIDVGLEVCGHDCTCKVCHIQILYHFSSYFFFIYFQAILAPFTDLHYRHSADTPESQLKYEYTSDHAKTLLF